MEFHKAQIVLLGAVVLIIGCASAVERAYQSAVMNDEICGHFGESGFLSGYLKRHPEAVFEEKKGDPVLVVRSRKAGRMELRPSGILDRSSVVTADTLQSFLQSYDKICGGRPSFYNDLPVVIEQVKRDAEETARRRQEEEDARRIAEAQRVKREKAEKEARLQKLEARRKAVQEAIADQNKLEARLLQRLHDVARLAADRGKSDDAQSALLPNAIKANYLFSTSFRIKQECEEVSKASDRPAFQSRRRAEVQSIADQTYRRGQVINFSGVCSLTRSGAGNFVKLRSPCIAAEMGVLFANDPTDQRVLEALELVSEHMDKAETFDANIMLSSAFLTTYGTNQCDIYQSPSLFVKVLSISNVRQKETKVSVARCVQGDCKNGQGRIDLADGDVYLGGFKNGEHDDIGAYAFKSSNAYTSGVFRNGKNHGTSLTQVSSGIVRKVYAEDLQLISISLTEARWRKWDGSEWKEWKETDALRVPDIAESSKARFTYEGDLQDGQPEGDGILIDASGYVLYAGKWRAGSPESAFRNP